MHRPELVRHELMARVRLLHVGDVHYPEALAERLTDIKDKGFPAQIAESSALKPLEQVVRSLLSEIESGFDGILFSGDLTCRGDIGGYKECLRYLSPVIASLAPDRIHAVPGNHDVDRAAVDPSGVDLFAKFESFKVAWDGIGLPVLATDGARMTEIVSPTGGRARILSINSSFGCGEKRLLPKEIADELDAMMKKFAATAAPKDAFSLLGETLDTPSFQQKDIDETCSGLVNGRASAIPVVLSVNSKLTSQIRCNGVIPFRQSVAVFKVERGDQIPVCLETGRIRFPVQIGSHSQASFGCGRANEVEHFFITDQRLGCPVLRDL